MNFSIVLSKFSTQFGPPNSEN